jgi:hypothetical protein
MTVRNSTFTGNQKLKKKIVSVTVLSFCLGAMEEHVRID